MKIKSIWTDWFGQRGIWLSVGVALCFILVGLLDLTPTLSNLSFENQPQKISTCEKAVTQYYGPIQTDLQLCPCYEPTFDNQTCNQFATIAIAGLYNSGTYWVWGMFQKCSFAQCRSRNISYSSSPRLFGKHTWLDDINMRSIQQVLKPNVLYPKELIVVIVKDPLTWFKSICKEKYNLHFLNATWYQQSCPMHIRYSQFINPFVTLRHTGITFLKYEYLLFHFHEFLMDNGCTLDQNVLSQHLVQKAKGQAVSTFFRNGTEALQTYGDPCYRRASIILFFTSLVMTFAALNAAKLANKKNISFYWIRPDI
ncbi:hypothetical protein RFI_21619 [Reticulomyxa filosa]|uniref:Uncharacterized protein n=1 Tax=Reticulomyxa filosa TaxID=46433 RepID=X6MQ08_RETFI|nr:hypothetical protein RFI_21619 [Reticulomyxa filosa]|eukprot:ETO15746.1 hypothetical protein RFI_21619 [Reticulomyxa filosa]